MPQNRYVPIRKCTGCRKVRPKSQLLRIVISDSKPHADPEGIISARGCYVCRNEDCIRKATEKGGISRSFKQGFSKESMTDLQKELFRFLY